MLDHSQRVGWRIIVEFCAVPSWPRGVSANNGDFNGQQAADSSQSKQPESQKPAASCQQPAASSHYPAASNQRSQHPASTHQPSPLASRQQPEESTSQPVASSQAARQPASKPTNQPAANNSWQPIASRYIGQLAVSRGDYTQIHAQVLCLSSMNPSHIICFGVYAFAASE